MRMVVSPFTTMMLMIASDQEGRLHELRHEAPDLVTLLIQGRQVMTLSVGSFLLLSSGRICCRGGDGSRSTAQGLSDCPTVLRFLAEVVLIRSTSFPSHGFGLL